MLRGVPCFLIANIGNSSIRAVWDDLGRAILQFPVMVQEFLQFLSPPGLMSTRGMVYPYDMDDGSVVEVVFPLIAFLPVLLREAGILPAGYFPVIVGPPSPYYHYVGAQNFHDPGGDGRGLRVVLIRVAPVVRAVGYGRLEEVAERNPVPQLHALLGGNERPVKEDLLKAHVCARHPEAVPLRFALPETEVTADYAPREADAVLHVAVHLVVRHSSARSPDPALVRRDTRRASAVMAVAEYQHFRAGTAPVFPAYPGEEICLREMVSVVCLHGGLACLPPAGERRGARMAGDDAKLASFLHFSNGREAYYPQCSAAELRIIGAK